MLKLSQYLNVSQPSVIFYSNGVRIHIQIQDSQEGVGKRLVDYIGNLKNKIVIMMKTVQKPKKS